MIKKLDVNLINQKQKNIKFGNYDKINSDGVVDENTLLENRDIIIAKIIPN